MNAKKRKVGYVSCEGISIDICIDDEINRNRAVHGDLVAVQLFPESQWLPLSQRERGSRKGDTEDDEDEEESAMIVRQLWQPHVDIISAHAKAGNEDESEVIAVHPIVEASNRLGLQPKGRVVAILESSHKKNGHIGGLQVQSQCRLEKGCYFMLFHTILKFVR